MISFFALNYSLQLYVAKISNSWKKKKYIEFNAPAELS